jgi:hypothetical protein
MKIAYNRYYWISKIWYLIFLFVGIQNCACQSPQLNIKIINLSNKRLYIGNLLSSCDSCDIERDVRFQCANKDSEPPMLRMLNANDTLKLVDKLLPVKIRIYTMNADSLDMSCKNGYVDGITKKRWVQIFSGDVDMKNKICTIEIR